MNYEIKNSFIKAKIRSFGAELNSLQKITNNFEYIWQADSKYWARHSPVLFPIVGRLKDDIYFYNIYHIQLICDYSFHHQNKSQYIYHLNTFGADNANPEYYLNLLQVLARQSH